MSSGLRDDRSEARPARNNVVPGWVAPAIAVVVAAAIVAIVVVRAAREQPVVGVRDASCDELAPDPAVVRYRFAIARAAPPDHAEVIAGLEARVAGGLASAIDLSELADAYFQRAQLADDARDHARAEELAKRSLAILPAPNGAAVVLAKIENARHEFREAIRIASAYVAQVPRAGAARIVLASAHLALGELDHAIVAAEEAVAAKPDGAAYLMRALVLQAQGRDAEAAFDFTRAVAVEEPGVPEQSARMRVLWGRFLLRRGELAGAAALFGEALRISPELPIAHAQQAELALRTGKLAEARAGFERAFAMSRQVRYLIDLARAQELANDVTAANRSRTQVEKLVRAELGERGRGHQLDLVEVLVDRGTPADLAEAIALGRDELSRRPSADTRFQLARALLRSGARGEAATHVRAALATGVRDARLYELASRIEDGPRKALYAREAARLDPGGSGWRILAL